MSVEDPTQPGFEEDWTTKLEPVITSTLKGIGLTMVQPVLVNKVVYDLRQRGQTQGPDQAYLQPVALHITEPLFSAARSISAFLRIIPPPSTPYVSFVQTEAPEDAVLHYYTTQWESFAAGVITIDKLFLGYFNRTVAHTEMDAVATIAFRAWKTNVLESLADDLRTKLEGNAALVDDALTAFIPENFTQAGLKEMGVSVQTAE
ncbi:hypothetical protein C8R46DRAFT_1192571 [Mycena filopes]|nr:hypothetical protein C8R46DRAFT_1192571 [Mycena filopes]